MEGSHVPCIAPFLDYVRSTNGLSADGCLAIVYLFPEDAARVQPTEPPLAVQGEVVQR
jgi:hypothetical protein